MRYVALVAAVAVVLSLPASAGAQSANPMMDAVKAQFAMIKGNLQKTAEKVPEPLYSFRPTPEVLAKAPRGEQGKKPAPDQRTVWVLRGGHPAPVPVKLGITDGSRTELVEGALEPGDVVITDAGGKPSQQQPPGGGGPRGFRIL